MVRKVRMVRKESRSIKSKEFNCWQCGACCHYVGSVPAMKDFDRGDGVCMFLEDNNSCGVYEFRPDACRTSVMFERFWSKSMTWEEYVVASEVICKVMDNEVNDAGHDFC